ncbi:hypothetical protein [Coleofasciculus sp.]|uniref:hypothetical protein n=1 Tax=Coleofasciculus sp. TaxID=3100458 RepID=UPI003A2696D5
MIVSDLARDRTTLSNQLTPDEVDRLQDKFWQEAVKPWNGARFQEISHLNVGAHRHAP